MSKTGTVKFFNKAKGFGFIEQDGGGEDLFVHCTNITDDQNLEEGDPVNFDEGWDDRKAKANALNITGGTGGPKDSSSGGSGGKGGGKGYGGKSGYGFGGSGSKSGGACFDCGEYGHRANDCPQGGGKGGGKGVGKRPPCRQWAQGHCALGDGCRFGHN